MQKTLFKHSLNTYKQKNNDLIDETKILNSYL